MHNSLSLSRRAVVTLSRSSDCNLHPSLAVTCEAADEVIGSPAQRDAVLARLEHLGSPRGRAAFVASSTHGNNIVHTGAIIEHCSTTGQHQAKLNY